MVEVGWFSTPNRAIGKGAYERKLMQKKTDIAYIHLQTFGIQLAMFIIKFAVTTLNNGAQIFMHTVMCYIWAIAWKLQQH